MNSVTTQVFISLTLPASTYIWNTWSKPVQVVLVTEFTDSAWCAQDLCTLCTDSAPAPPPSSSSGQSSDAHKMATRHFSHVIQEMNKSKHMDV